MTGNLVAGLVVVILGAALFQTLQPNRSERKPRRWVVHVAFWTGPAVTGLWILYDVYEGKEYLHPGYFGYFQEVVFPLMVIGFVSGSIGAVTLWIVEGVFRKTTGAA